MSITIASEETVFQGIMGFYTAQFPDQDLSEKSFFGLFARAQSQAIMLYLKSVEQADNDATPAYKQDADGTVLSKCSTEALDAWAITYGLPSGTAGIYGRKGATVSTGGRGVPTCSIGGTLIAAGSQLTDSTGQVTVETTADVTTNGPPNTLPVSLVSVATGLAANLPVGSVLTFVSPPVGVSAQMTLTSALVGGLDRETDGALLSRILFRLQNPPRGGTWADYRAWSEEATDGNGGTLAIARGHTYPLRSGLGSVDVVGLVAGSGASRILGTTQTTALLAYLNSKRPVTATVFVRTPTPVYVRIRVRVTASPKYPYDWDDGGTLTGILAGSTATTLIINNAALPANLRLAVTAGNKPRIQLISVATGAAATPYVRQVIGYAVDTPMAGQTTLTLGSTLGFTPQAADYFWGAGPVVDTVAANLLALVDSLGPSRQSGFAPNDDPWESSLTLARIADVVMESRASDGTRLIADIPDLAIQGISIAVGAGAFAAASFISRDFVLPELICLRAGGIEVRKSTT